MDIGNAFGCAQQCLGQSPFFARAGYAGGVRPQGLEGRNMLEQLRGHHGLVLLTQAVHGDALDEFGKVVEGAVILTNALESRQGDVCVGGQVLQDGSVILPPLGKGRRR